MLVNTVSLSPHFGRSRKFPQFNLMKRVLQGETGVGSKEELVWKKKPSISGLKKILYD
jgi:hypothetical protein